MNDKKKLKIFKDFCNEAVLDFKAEPCDETTEYIAKQFQTLIDLEEVKPRVMPPEKGMALMFINKYLEKSLTTGAVLSAEMIFGGANLAQLVDLEKEQQFMHNYINERYNIEIDGQMITLNTGK